jgi:hypothetical protein
MLTILELIDQYMYAQSQFNSCFFENEMDFEKYLSFFIR